MAAEFVLDARLAGDSLPVARWSLSDLRLMNDSRFPWLLLIPRRAGRREIHDLEPVDRAQLMDDMARASAGLATVTGAAKINVAALGNIVAQLHVHVVARQPGDEAWPGPVWGSGPALRYGPGVAEALVARLRAAGLGEGEAD